jgi:small subunit ribosomal protein S2
MTEQEIKANPAVNNMFKVGAHFAYSRSRRHPTVAPFIFGVKNRVEIFDLAKTDEALIAAKEFVKKLGTEGKQIVFVGGKNEAREVVKSGAISIDMPYVAGRWIGGSITNFSEIRSRVEKMLDLTAKREKGELSKYTKKERLLIDREIDNLERFFSGLVPMKELPKALFVIDSRREKIAVEEARKAGIPVVALCGSDCDLKEVNYAVPANDASVASIKYFVGEMVAAYEEGKKAALLAK